MTSVRDERVVGVRTKVNGQIRIKGGSVVNECDAGGLHWCWGDCSWVSMVAADDLVDGLRKMIDCWLTSSGCGSRLVVSLNPLLQQRWSVGFYRSRRLGGRMMCGAQGRDCRKGIWADGVEAMLELDCYGVRLKKHGRRSVVSKRDGAVGCMVELVSVEVQVREGWVWSWADFVGNGSGSRSVTAGLWEWV
ncbi:hypothetical protein NE237_014649 [Protea cynaroides]|uniref:Uncharacterized protein n=1 Tax=Protea cynaroides TaxID=273540 RepID=A0A9Q0QQC0_9MAGN|nr:hypothetical protein NE237_014649 [Protea cynaroides]